MLKRKHTSQGSKVVKRRRYTNPLYQRPIGARSTKKGVDTDISVSSLFTNMTNSVFVFPVNLIQSGTGSWNRVGRIVNMKSIRVKFKAKANYTDISNVQDAKMLRYVIVYDSQPNGVSPHKNDIFQDKSQSGVETSNWNSNLGYDNMTRFKILKDDTIVLEAPPAIFSSAGARPTGSVQTTEKVVDCYLKLNHITNYKSESSPASIADISTGGLYVIFLTDIESNVPSAGTLVIENASARLRYTDQ